MTDPMLTLASVSARYGSVEALRDVSIEVRAGEIVCLIGANGAGKSTLLNVISGIVPASRGAVRFMGESLLGRRAARVMRAGIVQVPEGRKLFPDLTVFENLEMGAYARPRASFARNVDFVCALFPRLGERRDQLAGLLSGGEQQMVAIGRALMSEPRLLLLDEPSMGLAPLVITDIFRTLRHLRDEAGITILLVEQNARAALKLADRGYVLVNGAVARTDAAASLLADPDIQEHFLGRRQRKQETIMGGDSR